MTRIGFADHLFLRMHHGIGYPVYNQFLWWFDETVQREDLEKLRHNLSDGLLARRVCAPSLPIARERWVNSSVSHELDLHPDPIESSEVPAWADGCLGSDIDPETGLGWRLSAAPLATGGTALALTASHMVADGGALIAAFRSANSRTARPRPTPDDLGPAAVVADVKDAVEQLRSVAGWLLTSAISALPIPMPNRSGATPAPARVSPRRSEMATDSAVDSGWTSPHVVAEVDAVTWNAAAEKWGGTSNSLFIAILTAASGDAGRASIGDTVQWSLPVSDRADDDIRSNATKIVKIEVPVTDSLDLSRIRSISKSAFTAFAARQAAGHVPAGISQALVQMLPDAVVARVPQPRDGAEGLASNLGVLPDDFTTVAGIRARAVSGRATFFGADAQFARSLDGGLTAWVCETNATVTVTVHAMDPDRFPDHHVLSNRMTAALARWGLSARFW